MLNTFMMSVPYAIAFLLGMGIPVGIFVLYQLTKRWTDTSKLVVILWCVCIGSILNIVLTTRILNLEALRRLTIDDFTSGFWSSRLLTLFLLGFSLTVILGSWASSMRNKPADPGSKIAWAFLVYLLGTILIGVVGPTVPAFSYKSLYVPIVLGALYFLANLDVRRFQMHLKLMLLLPVLGSLVAAMIAPDFALLRPYDGVLGLDFRLYGVATHANSLGPIALLLMLVEIYFPSVLFFRILILSASFSVFLLAQSKTAWLAAIGLLIFVYMPYQIKFSKKNTSLDRQLIYVVGLISVALLMVGYGAFQTYKLAHLFEEGDFATFTGRTYIWRLTMDEFFKNPLFGYGPELWGWEYRLKTGLFYVGQAHNQFVETLGKAGGIGFALLLAYLIVLFQQAIKQFRDSRGFVLALFVILIFRCITEAPLENGVILEWAFFTHALLVVFMVHYARASPKEAAPANVLATVGTA